MGHPASTAEMDCSRLGASTQDHVLGKFQHRLVQIVGGSPRIYAGGGAL
jgi:hypothetical protein